MKWEMFIRKLNQTLLLALLLLFAFIAMPAIRDATNGKDCELELPKVFVPSDEFSEQINSIVQPSPTRAVGIVLKSPDTCEVGELVRFDATESDVDSLVWSVIPETEDFEIADGDRRGFLSARQPGEFLVILSGAKGGQAFLEHRSLVVGGGFQPGPVTPVGPNSLSNRVKGWADKVPKEHRERKGLAVANVFKTLAESQIDVDKILEATAVANSAVLADDIEAWVPFLESLGAELDKLTEAGELSTPEQYKTVWVEIAKGIERAVPKNLAKMVKEAESSKREE